MTKRLMMAFAALLAGCNQESGTDAVNGQQNAALSAISGNTQEGAGAQGLEETQANQAAIGQGVRDSLAAPPRPPAPR